MDQTVLREIINQKQISQNELSRMTGIPASNLSLLINGKSPIYPGWKKRIAAALEVEEETLFID